MKIAIEVVAASGEVGQDRARAYSLSDGHIFVLADGAGGTGGGDLAADFVVEAAQSLSLNSAESCVAALSNLDRRLVSTGQTTAIVACTADGQIWGASVGDSSAWMMAASGVLDLTSGQIRKPLVGTGEAHPIGFGPRPFAGRLLVGSDGLFKYVAPDRIRHLASTLPIESIPAALIDAARIRSGALHDDIAVIAAG